MSVWKYCLGVFCLFGLLGCGGGSPDEEGGLIGTGFIHGTVSEAKVLASLSVEIKASTGEKFVIPLSASRRFTEEVEGEHGPHLLRTDLGNDEYRYAIAYDGSRSNIHSYSDVVLRNWFLVNNKNIDSEFESAGALFDLPTQVQFNAIAEQLFSVVQLALNDYGVTGEQLLTASYDANNTGIDEYLDSNPVIINDQKIKVVLTDPDFGYQSSTDVSLGLSTSMADTSSPTVVNNVRALGSGLSQVVVLWDPAFDNVGVRGYQVLRDGIVITTTPYPVYTDTDARLQSNTTYSYTVIALDGSGNLAPVSESALGTTLSTVDSQPPPTPTGLSPVEVSTSRVSLDWNISLVQDIASFNVYRYLRGEPEKLLLRTTSDQATDASVNGGIEYCYRVQAVDSSGNVSGLSDELCVTTGGSVVTPSTDTNATAADLILPEIDVVNCSATLTGSPIFDDRILDQPCYLVTEDITVGQGGDLVINAGTILMFSQGVGITVNENGSLAANGTKEQPVVFTGLEDQFGAWRGIVFNKTRSADNKIVNSVIQYAGGAGQVAGLMVNSTIGFRASLRVEGSLIRFTDGFGFSMSDLGTSIDSFSGNVVTKNKKVADIGPLLLQSIGTDNDFSGNDEQIINVPRLPIDEPVLIPNLGVPLVINGLSVELADLTIEAGVELRFQAGSWLQVDGGDLLIKGTTASPVLLTSNEKPGAPWGGVHLLNSPASSLEGVTIEYGGAPVLQSNANLTLSNSTASLVNVTFANSSSPNNYVLDANSSFSLYEGVIE